MKRIFVLWPLVLLPLFSIAQFDTNSVRFSEYINWNDNEYLRVTAIDSHKVGIMNSEGHWLIPPMFGAIADFEEYHGNVSARDSSFQYSVRSMEYWNDEPLAWNWGVADGMGNWLIPAIYYAPFDLAQPWQIKRSGDSTDLYVGLQELWPNEYKRVYHLGGNLFVLQNDMGELAIRDIKTNEWIVTYGKYWLQPGDTALLVAFDKGDDSTQIRVTVLDSTGAKRTYFGISKILEVFRDQGMYIDATAESGMQNSERGVGFFLATDSVFAKWYLHNYWGQLSYAQEEFEGFDDTNYFDHVWADTVFTSMPDNWSAYYRVEEYYYDFHLNTSESSTFTVLEIDEMLSHGSRGPAVERAQHHWTTVQEIDGKMHTLSFEDCFFQKDTKDFEEMLLRTVGDTASFYIERWGNGNFNWSLQQDSLLIHFPVRSGVEPYTGWRQQYKTVAFHKQELGKWFLSEKKRAKGLREEY